MSQSSKKISINSMVVYDIDAFFKETCTSRKLGVEIARGGFARVFEKRGNPDRVVKICINDNAYETYVKTIVNNKNENNPWFPKIFSIECVHVKYTQTNSEINAVVVEMEKLKPVEFHSTELSDYKKKKYRDLFLMYKLINDDKTILSYKKLDIIKILRKEKYRNRKIKNLMNALRVIRTVKRGSFLWVEDFHGKNIMIRGKQPVFTDPVC